MLSTPLPGFMHEALLYDGPGDLAVRAAAFAREGVARGEPVMIAMVPEALGVVRGALGADADAVRFVDMSRAGRNPAWIIPAWQRFVDDHAPGGTPVRGIGEPIWAARTADELVECQLHEALINVAFAERAGMRLLCPYDKGTLGPGVLHEARCSHHAVVEDGRSVVSVDLRDADHPSQVSAPLPPPPRTYQVLGIERRTLHDVRALVARTAAGAGLAGTRVQDAVTGVNELATNSVRHGGGNGVLRIWRTEDALVYEVRDRGRITDPLAGRRRPEPDATGRRGLWIATQTADLLQIRSGADGSTVRFVLRLG